MIKSFFIFLFFVSVIYPQEKYFIYFKDKGNEPGTLNKSSVAYAEALSSLTDRAIERRKKVMGEDNIVSYEDLPVNKNYVEGVKALGINIVHELKWFNSVSAYLNESLLQQVLQLPYVLKVERVKTLIEKPSAKEQYDLNQIQKIEQDSIYGVSHTQLVTSGIPTVHALGITGYGVLIGMLDSGFDWAQHEAFTGTVIIGEHDFINNDSITANQPGDDNAQHNHGTSTFSMVGGNKPGSFMGAAYGARFMLAKTENISSETHAEEDNYAAALIWMEERGVDITSSSLGYTEFDAPEFSYTYNDMNGQTTIVTRAAEAAFRRGVLVFSAAGNEGNKAWHYISAPSDGFNVLCVGAVSSSNTLASYSGRGPSSDGRIKPDVLTQGTGNYGASAGTVNGYASTQGTSNATPIASGIGGLLLSAYPHLTNVQARRILQQSCDNAVAPNNDRGYGLLYAPNVLSYPNIRAANNIYRLYKAFIGQDVVTSSVVLNYSVNNVDFSATAMTFDGTFRYYYDLSSLTPGSKIKFYFTYNKAGNVAARSPETGVFEFSAGEDVVSSVSDNTQPENYVLSQNYPNPFNNRTNINFTARENDKAELLIIDVTGQKVITLFNGLAREGVNTVAWDGRNESGINTASGIYYYILKLAGKEYGRKMVLLK